MLKFSVFVFASCTALVITFGCNPNPDVKWGPTQSALTETDTAQPDVDTDTSQPDTAQPDVGPLECTTESDCNDGNSCTVDSCVNGSCVHQDVICPDGFTCNPLGQCVIEQKQCGPLDDDNECTTDVCDPATGKVSHVPKSCDDGDEATNDFCDPDKGCVYAASCWDGDACTVEHFNPVTGECVYQPRCPEDMYCTASGGCIAGCNADADCDDDNTCTVDACVGGDDQTVGYCQHKDPCDDGDPTTHFLCNDTLPQGDPEQCIPITFGGCTEDDQPAYDEACQQLICSAAGEWVATALFPCPDGTVCQDGACELIEKGCTSDEECADVPCTLGVCNQTTGLCEYSTLDCADGEVCDAATGQCVATLIECTGDQPAYDPTCAEVICSAAGEWVVVPTVICSGGGVCTDGVCEQVICSAAEPCPEVLCATVACESNQCVYTPQACADGEVCDAATGTCVSVPTEPCGGSCDDGDPSTLDYCDVATGVCKHHQPVGCEPGKTVLDPDTGLCVAVEPAVCELGDTKCDYIEGLAQLMVCAEDDEGVTYWTTYEVCGLETEGWQCWLTDPPICVDVD
jgi:hypothetical protein